LIILALALVFCGRAGADEGMWTFDNMPMEQLKLDG